MDFDTVLKEFGRSLGNLKRAYAEKYRENTSYLQIVITDDDYISITPTDASGRYIECFREWVNTESDN